MHGVFSREMVYARCFSREIGTQTVIYGAFIRYVYMVCINGFGQP